MEEKKNNYLTVIVILSVMFGSLSGILAEIVTRNYLDSLYAPYSGEINVSNGFRKQRLEIKEAKNVVVEQNDKTESVINAAENSMVGIYKKINPSKSVKTDGPLDLGTFYKKGQEAGQGFIITSDGWIVTNFKIDDVAGYAVVAPDRKVYGVDRFLTDKATGFNFIHIDAKDLQVTKFADQEGIRNGQLAVAVSWGGKSILTSIVNKNEGPAGLVRSSDVFSSKIATADSVSGALVLFGIDGGAVGFIDKNGKIEPIGHFTQAFASLLSDKAIKRPGFGVNYIDLSLIIPAMASTMPKQGALIQKDEKGVAVVSGGTANLAGLKEGDAVLSINNIAIEENNSLTDVLQKFAAGSQITIEYQRGTEKKEVEIKLGELK